MWNTQQAIKIDAILSFFKLKWDKMCHLFFKDPNGFL